MSPMESNEYLIERFLTESLSEPEERLLLERIKLDSSLARRLYDHVYVDMSIHRLRSLETLPNLFEDDDYAEANKGDTRLDFDMLVRLAAASPSIAPQQIPQCLSDAKAKTSARIGFRRFAGFLQSGRVPAFLSMFLILAIIVPYFLGLGQSSQPNSAAAASIGRITNIAETSFPDNKRSFRPGHLVGEETIHLASGLLELRLASNVRLVMEGETTIDIKSPERVFCRKGRLSVDVPKGAEGFMVYTPLMNIRDLGTKFVVDVSEDICDVHEIEGRIEVDPLDHTIHIVEEGLSFYTRNDHSIGQRPADSKLYVSEEKMIAENQKFRAKLFASRDETRSALLTYSDSVLLNLDFSAGGDGLNVFQSQRPKEVLDIIGCQRGPGRFLGFDSVSFTSPGDRIVASVPEKRRSFTLFASIRLNDLSQASNPILSIDGAGGGSLLWQVNYIGELQLLLGVQANGAPVKYSSKVAFQKNDIGGWLHVATVVDAERKTVTHYIDGVQVGMLPMDASAIVDFSKMEIGGWYHGNRKENKYGFFNGQMGEFLLFGQALTEEEVRNQIAFIR